MSGWATFWWVVGLLVVICAILQLVVSDLPMFFGLLICGLSLITFGRLLRCITNLLENQRKILRAVDPDAKFVND